MTWIVKWQGAEFTSDDLTLGELDRLERETGTPWSALNPLRELKVARAFLALAVEKAGGDPESVAGLTLGQIKAAFDFRPDEPFPSSGDGEADEAPLDPSSPGSSSGAPGGGGGPRRKHAKNA